MNLRRALPFAPFVVVLTGCGATLAVPDLPERVTPRISEKTEAKLDAEPAEGAGRVLFDAVGEPAKVTAAEGDEPTKALCITPCVVELGVGVHSVTFSSLTDPERTSTTAVAVSDEPTVVRHAMGQERPVRAGYFGGFLLTTLGSFFVFSGSLVLADGLVGDTRSRNPETGVVTDNRNFIIAMGSGLLAAGLAGMIPGILVQTHDQPLKQPGSTVQFVR